MWGIGFQLLLKMKGKEDHQLFKEGEKEKTKGSVLGSGHSVHKFMGD